MLLGIRAEDAVQVAADGEVADHEMQQDVTGTGTLEEDHVVPVFQPGTLEDQHIVSPIIQPERPRKLRRWLAPKKKKTEKLMDIVGRKRIKGISMHTHLL